MERQYNIYVCEHIKAQSRGIIEKFAPQLSRPKMPRGYAFPKARRIILMFDSAISVCLSMLLLQFLFCCEPILKVVTIFAAALQINFISAGLNLRVYWECLFNL